MKNYDPQLLEEIEAEALAALTSGDPLVMKKALENIHAISHYGFDVTAASDRLRLNSESRSNDSSYTS